MGMAEHYHPNLQIIMGVYRRHGTGRRVDTDVAGQGHVLATDDDLQIRMIVLCHPHRPQISSRTPVRQVGVRHLH